MRPYQSNPLYMPRHHKYSMRVEEQIHTDGLLSILGSFEDHRTASFGPTIRPNVDVSADDVARGSKQILQVLPAGLVRQLKTD